MPSIKNEWKWANDTFRLKEFPDFTQNRQLNISTKIKKTLTKNKKTKITKITRKLDISDFEDVHIESCAQIIIIENNRVTMQILGKRNEKDNIEPPQKKIRLT